MTLSAREHPQGVMTAHFIDMGQADATLLEFSCGAILIDAGAQFKDDNNAYNTMHKQTLIGYLATFFNRRTGLNRTLDGVYITHNHIDHTHALREVAETFKVNDYIGTGLDASFGEAIIDPQWIRQESSIRHQLITSADFTEENYPQGISTPTIDPVNCNGVNPDIRVLSGRQLSNPGWTQRAFNNANNHSLVIRVGFGEATFLFTGDLEHEGIETLLKNYRNAPGMLDIDVYQGGALRVG